MPTLVPNVTNGDTLLDTWGDAVRVAVEELQAAPPNHGSRHQPGGVDALPTATAGASAPADAAAVGVSTSLARADHKHSREATAVAGASAPGDAAAVGVAATISRSDHKHSREAYGASATVQAFGDAQTPGVVASISRSDHKHGMPAAPGGSSEWDATITKAATESVVSSVAVQNDDHLLIAGLTLDSVYLVEFLILYDGAGAGDIKIDVGEDATIRGAFAVTGLTAANAAFSGSMLANQTETSTHGAFGVPQGIMLRGLYRSGGGTLRLRWAQGTSNASATRVLAGSKLRYALVA